MRYFEAPVLEDQRKPLLPHKIISGSLPGATQIRIGGDENILIDGLNKRITVTSAGGSSVGIGTIPGTNNFGFFSFDQNGNLLKKTEDGVDYYYNTTGDLVLRINAGNLDFYDILNSDTNKLRLGKMPDNSYNLVIAKDNIEVDDLF